MDIFAKRLIYVYVINALMDPTGTSVDFFQLLAHRQKKSEKVERRC